MREARCSPAFSRVTLLYARVGSPLIPSSTVALLASEATSQVAEVASPRRTRSVGRTLKVTLVAVVLAAAIAAVAVAVQPTPTTWQVVSLSSVLRSNLGSLQGVGCTPHGICVLAGASDYAVTSVPDGPWRLGPSQELDKGFLADWGESSVGDTSCGIATCVVTGDDLLATLGRNSSPSATFSGVVKTAVGTVSGFSSVWCGSFGLCVATRVDGTESTGRAGEYDYPDELATSSDGGYRWAMHAFGHVLEGSDVVACENARFCLFPGTRNADLEAGTDSGADLHPIALQHEPASARNLGAGDAISCSTSRCLVGYGDGWVAVVSDLGRVWSWHRAIPRVDWGLGTWISSIACATAMDCIATVPSWQEDCEDECLVTSPSLIVATEDGGEKWHPESIPSGFTLPNGGPIPIGCALTRCYVIGTVGDAATLATATPW